MRLCHNKKPPEIIEFQSTHLLRDASVNNKSLFSDCCISIHASLARCVYNSMWCHLLYLVFQSTHLLRDASGMNPQQIMRMFSNFNPRISCEMRLEQKSIQNTKYIISIHASLARCVSWESLNTFGAGNFNPRISCEMRPAFRKHGSFKSYISFHASLARCVFFRTPW